MRRRYLTGALGLLVLAGCHSPVQKNVDDLLCGRADARLDPQPPGLADTAPHMPYAAAGKGGDDSGLQRTAAQAPGPKGEQLPEPKLLPGEPRSKFLERLAVPPGVPGQQAPPIVMPPWKTTPRPAYNAFVEKHFPSLPDVGAEPTAGSSPTGRPLTLADLQKLAFTNSPLLRQAASDVEAAQGTLIQSGAYPNPTFTYLANSHGPSGGPLAGVGVSQTIKTMGKLKLAQAAAEMDLRNAQLAYRRAETDLMASVRSGYFAVLVAQENVRANRALVKLTDELYKVQVQQLKGGQVATYEPLQQGVYSAQARMGLIVARNSYTMAWKQLAAALGLPGMPPTELAGRIDTLPLPLYRYDTALAHVLTNHTDVKTAENGIQKARFNLRAAEVIAVPDVTVSGTVENDLTQPPPPPISLIGYVNVSAMLPVWDLNKGAIRSAQAALLRAVEEPHRVRDDLTGRVADAYHRYDENRALLELYRRDVLPKQVQAFRAAVLRWYKGDLGYVAYTDLVASEQSLVGVIGTYLTTLGAQWQAVADLASLLQTDDVFQVAEGQLPLPPLPDLEHMLALPCDHPCSPLPQPGLKGADPSWFDATILPATPPAEQGATAPPPAKGGKQDGAQPPGGKQQAAVPAPRALLLPPAEANATAPAPEAQAGDDRRPRRFGAGP
jgi:cobalt-zinc-cadmium efflux system outer membrane protein